MALAADLAASPDNLTAVTTNQRSFSILSYPGPGKSTRIDIATSSAEPATLEISHRTEGTGDAKREVHVMTVRRKKVNSTTSKMVESVVTLSLRCPHDQTITVANVKADVNSLVNLLVAVSANFDRIARGEV